MSINIAIISRKGGAGKTSTAYQLAAGFCEAGQRVLLVDMDGQANLSYSMKAEPKPNICDLLIYGKSAAGVIQHTTQGDIIAGAEEMDAANTIITDEDVLSRALDTVRSQYDYIIIDTPAVYGMAVKAATAAADGILITIAPEMYALQGLNKLTERIEAIKARHPNIKIYGLVITQFKGFNYHRQVLDGCKVYADNHGIKLFDPIRTTVKIGESNALGVPIYEYDPNGNGAADYAKLVYDLFQEIKKG